VNLVPSTLVNDCADWRPNVRHTFTDYDELLAEGYDPDSARHFVVARMEKTLQAWGVRRRLAPEG
jgi:hypothetical protein